jgi:hypothetical protein
MRLISRKVNFLGPRMLVLLPWSARGENPT